MKSLFQYTDYRVYLKDFYLHKKSESNFTYEKFSQLAGLKSRSYFKSVIEGSRDLNPDSIFKTAQALELSFEEHRFFEALVLENQSPTEEQRAYYNLARQKLQQKQIKSKTSDPHLLDYPFFLSALTLLADHPRGIDAGTFSMILRLKQQIGADFLQKMVTAGLVRVAGGLYFYDQNHTVFHDSKDWKRRQKLFLLNQAKLGIAKSERSYDNSKLYSQVFLGRRKNLKIYQELISELLHDLAKQESEYEFEKTSLFQLNVQLFEA